jgi:hypothetical protein
MQRREDAEEGGCRGGRMQRREDAEEGGCRGREDAEGWRMQREEGGCRGRREDAKGGELGNICTFFKISLVFTEYQLEGTNGSKLCSLAKASKKALWDDLSVQSRVVSGSFQILWCAFLF